MIKDFDGIEKKVGYAYFFVFVALCVVFYKERMAYIDSATQLFMMINKEGFEIFVSRYSMFLSQLIPVGLIKVGAPLKLIMIAFSACYALILLGSYHLAAHKYKQIGLALVPVFLFVSASDTFAHAISETVQLFSYASLLGAFLLFHQENGSFAKPSVSVVVGLFVLLLLNFFIHPVSLFFVLFLFLYAFFKEELKVRPYKLIIPVVWVGFFAVKTVFFSKGSHDESFLNELKHLDEIIPNLFSVYPIHFIKQHFLQFYFLPTAMFVAVVMHFLKEKKYLFTAGYVAFFLGFWLLSIIIYHKGDSNHGMERSFLPFLFLAAVPFFDAVLPKWKTKLKLAPVAVMAVLFCAVGINLFASTRKFGKRVDKVQKIIYAARQSQLGNKFYISANDSFVKTDMEVQYALTVETLLLSGLDGKEETISVFFDFNQLEGLENRFSENVFYYMNFWTIRNTDVLNPKYFSLSGHYNEIAFDRRVVKKVQTDFETSGEGCIPVSENQCVALGANEWLELDGNKVMSQQAEYGFNFFPGIDGNHEVAIEMQTFGSDSVALVSSIGDSFYINSASTQKALDGWEKLNLYFDLPKNYVPNEHKVYVWNFGSKKAYFDNFKFEALTRPTQVVF